jgi:hypothetical protein
MVESTPCSPFPRRHGRFVALVVASTLVVATAVTLRLQGTPSAPSKTPLLAWATPRALAGAVRGTTTTPTTASNSVLNVVTAATPTTLPPVVAPVAVTVPVAATATVPVAAPPVPVAPTIATLVAEVEAAGIEPGSNWSWSVGDTATHCGAISGSGTGCTYGAAGLEYTVFSGSPTLSLVAHELANAETQNDAVPDLVNDVAAADAGTSWSPTDAVATCLVAHFVGVQDAAAGTWTCSPAVAAFVASNIHDTLATIVGPLPG